MQLIDKIEINYFRSIYSIQLKKTSKINVFVGKNDAGKSNILKSLNLFFNNKSSFKEEFNFDHDLSLVREDEARNAKGRMTIWIKIHFNNIFGWDSLPEKFSVKRSWNRYNPNPDQELSPKNIPSISVAKFLNKIQFFYVPTLRGSDVMSEFLILLYDALSERHADELNSSSAGLATMVSELTESMSLDLKRHFGFESKVKMPESLRDIFKSLEFNTSEKGADVPLRFRGGWNTV